MRSRLFRRPPQIRPRSVRWIPGKSSTSVSDAIQEDVVVDVSHAVDVRADATRTEAVTANASFAPDVFASAARLEAVTVDASFTQDVRAAAAHTEAATVGDAYAVVARAAVGRTEGVTVGDSYADALPGEGISEGVTLGDSYTVAVRAAATRTESVSVGDSYVAVGGTTPATSSAGPMLQPPKPLPEVTAALLFVQSGQEFAMTLEVSSAFELSFLGETIPLMALGIETASEFTMDFAQPEVGEFEFRMLAPPLRSAPVVAVPKFEAMRAQLDMEQRDGPEIEMTLEVSEVE